jgi:uroporphyrinogen decarboxylase
VNSLERVVAAVRMQPVDRVPVIAQVFAHAAVAGGVAIEDYVRDGETLARCQLDALRKYGYDAVFSVMGTSVETEALGSVLHYAEDWYPSVESYALSPQGDWSGLCVPDPHRSGRMPEMLRALGILRRELQDEVPVIGCILGPFTLAGQLLGLENALYLAADSPGRLEQLLDFSTGALIRFGRAQIEAGAHLPMVFDPAASPAVIPPAFFREFELPRLRRLFQALKEAGAIANWLHIAGPAAGILPYYAGAGVDIANFDYNVSMAEARDQLPGTCLDGNIKSLAFVEGSPGDIAEASGKLLSFFRDRGGFILSSGCEIPPESRPENIAALVRAAVTVQKCPD